jgi:hypothetical protein
MLTSVRATLMAFCGAAAVAAGGGTAVAMAHSSAHASGVVCGAAGARTVTSDPVARVFVSGHTAYACAAGASRSYALGGTQTCLMSALLERVALARRLVAYAVESCGVDTGWTTVTVRRLSDGKVLSSHPATTQEGVESHQTVGSLVLKADGAVAWVATADSIGPPRFVRQVERADRRGFSVLDSGSSVGASSLILSGSTISWRHGSATRRASLR